MNVAIVDYGAGNLTSLKAALVAVGAAPFIAREPAELNTANRIIVPGVGHFSATAQLRQSGLELGIRDAVKRGVPLLGICLGMQWLFEGSEEAPDVPGLAALHGFSRRFPPGIKSPHVGWNQLQQTGAVSQLLRDVPQNSYAYFTHSYRIAAASQTIATSDYAGNFSAVVEQGNIFGVQFHPEKSSTVGLRILENFCSLPC
jgi:imidazole glycerol-phosphate synthase subunit HisH